MRFFSSYNFVGEGGVTHSVDLVRHCRIITPSRSFSVDWGLLFWDNVSLFIDFIKFDFMDFAVDFYTFIDLFIFYQGA